MAIQLTDAQKSIMQDANLQLTTDTSTRKIVLNSDNTIKVLPSEIEYNLNEGQNYSEFINGINIIKGVTRADLTTVGGTTNLVIDIPNLTYAQLPSPVRYLASYKIFVDGFVTLIGDPTTNDAGTTINRYYERANIRGDYSLIVYFDGENENSDNLLDNLDFDIVRSAETGITQRLLNKRLLALIGAENGVITNYFNITIYDPDTPISFPANEKIFYHLEYRIESQVMQYTPTAGQAPDITFLKIQ